MRTLRIYGRPPYSIVLLHGGPGAPGEMAPVARELCSEWGILEPMQRADTMEGQVVELRTLIEKEAKTPITLVGFSWGAMLGLVFTAGNPNIVKKLVLISSGVFDEKFAPKIQETRNSRLNESERNEINKLSGVAPDAPKEEKNRILKRLGELFTIADSYDPITLNPEVIEIQYEINRKCGRAPKCFGLVGASWSAPRELNALWWQSMAISTLTLWRVL